MMSLIPELFPGRARGEGGGRRYGGLLLPAATLVLPLIVFCAGAWLTWQATWRDATADLLRAADAGAEYSARTLYGYQVAAGRINDLLRGLSDQEVVAREAELHGAVRRLVAELPHAEAAYVVDRNGYPLLSASIFPVPHDLPTAADRDFFRALSEPDPPDPHLSQLYRSRFDDKVFFALSRRRVDTGNGLPQGQFDGLVNLSVEPGPLAAGLRNFLASRGDEMLLVRGDRHILARTGPAEVLWPPTSVPRAFTRDSPARVDASVFPPRSDQQLVARRWAADLPVYIAVHRPRAAIVALWREKLGTHLIFGAPATLALFLLSLRVRSSQQRLALSNARLQVALEGSEDRLRRAQSAGGVFPFEVGASGIASCDDGFRGLFGLPPHAQVDLPAVLARVHPDDRGRLAAGYDLRARAGGAFLAEIRVQTGDEPSRWVMLAGDSLAGMDGRPARISGVGMDITQRKQAELALQQLNQELEARVHAEVAAREQAQARLVQAQRLEALGQLAAGVAHDFNNVLQAVSGGLSLIERRADDGPAVRRFATLAGEAAHRGASITARLLAFARKGDLQAETIAIAALLTDLREMLAATLGGSIDVAIDCAAADLAASADKAQLETVLVNLAINARDAMPRGGRLTLAAAAEAVAPEVLHPAGLPPGCYVRLSASDTGAGMNATTLSRASEPFFTTKGVGQGTGLGLAMARGFAQQSGGGLTIESTLGLGCTVTLWLPQARGAAPGQIQQLSPVSGPEGVVPGAGGRVLLVDDDVRARSVLAIGLRDAGYDVDEAADGLAALSLLSSGMKPDALVTDYAMPGMDGLVLMDEMRGRVPGLPVLLVTGFVDARVARVARDLAGDGVALLRKPIRVGELVERVAALLA